MSKHPAMVKIALLEFLEARLKDVVDALTTPDIKKYENARDWLEDYLKDLSPKPADYMTWFKDSYSEITSGDIEAVFAATILATSDANMTVKVYDPFTTEMDFYLFLDVTWAQYLRIYRLYYDLDFKGWRQVIWEYQYSGEDEILDLALGEDRDDVFNASTSKSEIYYTIQQMKNILDHGNPRTST